MSQVYITDNYSKKWVKCVCCGEQIRPGEQVFGLEGRKGLTREKYCLECMDKGYLLDNNPDARFYEQDQSDGEEGLRQAEDYAAYKAAGVSAETYYRDRDAGYCN